MRSKTKHIFLVALVICAVTFLLVACSNTDSGIKGGTEPERLCLPENIIYQEHQLMCKILLSQRDMQSSYQILELQVIFTEFLILAYITLESRRAVLQRDNIFIMAMKLLEYFGMATVNLPTGYMEVIRYKVLTLLIT